MDLAIFGKVHFSFSKHFYTYDEGDKLISEKYSGDNSSTGYSYHADGSLKSETLTTGTAALRSCFSREYGYSDGRLKTVTESLTLPTGSSQKTTLSFRYDRLGNCTHYYKANGDSSQNLFWERGSMLKKYADKNAEYFYNAKGLRFKKKVGNETTNFYYDGEKLIAARKKNSRTVFYYDAEGIYGMSHNEYFVRYIKDAQNNVIALAGPQGEVAVYSYDAWGNCTIVKDTDGIGAINPIRWKSQC